MGAIFIMMTLWMKEKSLSRITFQFASEYSRIVIPKILSNGVSLIYLVQYTTVHVSDYTVHVQGYVSKMLRFPDNTDSGQLTSKLIQIC